MDLRRYLSLAMCSISSALPEVSPILEAISEFRHDGQSLAAAIADGIAFLPKNVARKKDVWPDRNENSQKKNLNSEIRYD